MYVSIEISINKTFIRENYSTCLSILNLSQNILCKIVLSAVWDGMEKILYRFIFLNL
jgi:hypothetical protein